MAGGIPAVLINAQWQGQRLYSTEWEDLTDPDIVIDEAIVDPPFPFIENNTQSYKKLRVTGTHDGEISGGPVSGVDINVHFSFRSTEGEIDVTFATDTLVNAIVMPEVLCHSDTYIKIEGASIDGDPVEVFYPAVAERFSIGEEPQILTQGLYASGHYSPDQTSVFIAYIPEVVSDSLKVSIIDSTGSFEASALFLYVWNKFDTLNFDQGSSTTYTDPSVITQVADLAVRKEIKGKFKSRTVSYQFGTDSDSALMHRALREQLTCVFDSFPLGSAAKRYDNLIVGYLANSQTITNLNHGDEYATTITESRAKK